MQNCSKIKGAIRPTALACLIAALATFMSPLSFAGLMNGSTISVGGTSCTVGGDCTGLFGTDFSNLMIGGYNASFDASAFMGGDGTVSFTGLIWDIVGEALADVEVSAPPTFTTHPFVSNVTASSFDVTYWNQIPGGEVISLRLVTNESAVPAPATLALLCIGVAGLVSSRRKKS